MRKIIENVNEISDEDIFVIASTVTNGTWISGFFNKLSFEAKVDDRAFFDGIKGGRVMNLDVSATVYTEENSFSANIARFCNGEWLIRPIKAEHKKTIKTLISHLEKLPSHEEFEAQKQTA